MGNQALQRTPASAPTVFFTSRMTEMDYPLRRRPYVERANGPPRMANASRKPRNMLPYMERSTGYPLTRYNH